MNGIKIITIRQIEGGYLEVSSMQKANESKYNQ